MGILVTVKGQNDIKGTPDFFMTSTLSASVSCHKRDFNKGELGIQMEKLLTQNVNSSF